MATTPVIKERFPSLDVDSEGNVSYTYKNIKCTIYITDDYYIFNSPYICHQYNISEPDSIIYDLLIYFETLVNVTSKYNLYTSFQVIDELVKKYKLSSFFTSITENLGGEVHEYLSYKITTDLGVYVLIVINNNMIIAQNLDNTEAQIFTLTNFYKLLDYVQ